MSLVGRCCSKKSLKRHRGIEMCNNRIQKADPLNQRCALEAGLESIFFGGSTKILFRQHRSRAAIRALTSVRPVWPSAFEARHPLSMTLDSVLPQHIVVECTSWVSHARDFNCGQPAATISD